MSLSIKSSSPSGSSVSSNLPTPIQTARKLKTTYDNNKLGWWEVYKTFKSMESRNMLFSNITKPYEFDTKSLDESFIKPLIPSIEKLNLYDLTVLQWHSKHDPYDIDTFIDNTDPNPLQFCKYFICVLSFGATMMACSPLVNFVMFYSSKTESSTAFNVFITFLSFYAFVFILFIIYGCYVLYLLRIFKFHVYLSYIIKHWCGGDNHDNNYNDDNNHNVVAKKHKICSVFTKFFVFLCVFAIYLLETPLVMLIFPRSISEHWINNYGLRCYNQRNIYERETMRYIIHIMNRMLNRITEEYKHDPRMLSLILYIINYKIIRGNGDKIALEANIACNDESYIARAHEASFGDIEGNTDKIRINYNSDHTNDDDDDNNSNTDGDTSSDDTASIIVFGNECTRGGDGSGIDNNDLRDEMDEFNGNYLQYEMNPSISFLLKLKKDKKAINIINGNEEYKQYVFYYIFRNITDTFISIALSLQVIMIICSIINGFDGGDVIFAGFLFLSTVGQIVTIIYTWYKDNCNDCSYLFKMQRYLLFFDPMVKNTSFLTNFGIYPKGVSLRRYIKDIEFNKKLIYRYFVNHFGNNRKLLQLLDDYYHMNNVTPDVLESIIDEMVGLNQEFSKSICAVILEYTRVCISKDKIDEVFSRVIIKN